MQITDLFFRDDFKMVIQYLLNREWRRVKTPQIPEVPTKVIIEIP